VLLLLHYEAHEATRGGSWAMGRRGGRALTHTMSGQRPSMQWLIVSDPTLSTCTNWGSTTCRGQEGGVAESGCSRVGQGPIARIS